jgi:hypothetical protein
MARHIDRAHVNLNQVLSFATTHDGVYTTEFLELLATAGVDVEIGASDGGE